MLVMMMMMMMTMKMTMMMLMMLMTMMTMTKMTMVINSVHQCLALARVPPVVICYDLNPALSPFFETELPVRTGRPHTVGKTLTLRPCARNLQSRECYSKQAYPRITDCCKRIKHETRHLNSPPLPHCRVHGATPLTPKTLRPHDLHRPLQTRGYGKN